MTLEFPIGKLPPPEYRVGYQRPLKLFVRWPCLLVIISSVNSGDGREVVLKLVVEGHADRLAADTLSGRH
jgi:hypothetical protein